MVEPWIEILSQIWFANEIYFHGYDKNDKKTSIPVAHKFWIDVDGLMAVYTCI